MRIDPTGMFGLGDGFELPQFITALVPDPGSYRRPSCILGMGPSNSGYLSPEGRDWLIREEGSHVRGGLHTMYNDSKDLSKANATQGYGTLIHYGPINGSESSENKAGWLEPKAQAELDKKLSGFEKSAESAVGTSAPQSELDGLIIFAYNVGSVTKDVRKALATGVDEKIQAAMQSHNTQGGKVNPALSARRSREAAVVTGDKSVWATAQELPKPNKAREQ